jgi:hypothetical protein
MPVASAMIRSSDSEGLLDDLLWRHRQLLSENALSKATPEERARLVDDLIASGAMISDGGARDKLRNMLYFWVADQTARDERPRDKALPVLEPFATSAEPQSVDAAQETAPEVQPKSDTKSDLSAPSPSEPRKSKASVLETLRAGVLTGILGANVAAVEAADAGTPGRTTIDVDKEARARAILRIAALARQWRLSKDPDVKRGYLLSGKALAEASVYVDDDPDIHALVEASEKDAQRDKRLRLWLYVLLVTLIIFGLIGYILLITQKYRLALQADALQNEVSQQEAVKGEDRKFELYVRQVVDQVISTNDIQPLRTFLQTYSSASTDQLERFSLSPSKQNEVAAPVGSIVPLPTPTDQTSHLGTCTGYLWFGSADSSRIVGQRDPATLRSGEVVTLDKNGFDVLRLRAGLPDRDTYKVSRQIGTVPTGSKVTITGDPQSFLTYPNGRSGKPITQIWANVTVPRTNCTTVFIQFFGSPVKLDSVVAALAQIDVQTPPAEPIPSAKGLREVRYFWADDKGVAELIADKVGSVLGFGKLKLVPLTDFPNKPPSGTVEIWVDLSG